jgi:hypothetical protein
MDLNTDNPDYWSSTGSVAVGGWVRFCSDLGWVRFCSDLIESARLRLKSPFSLNG